MRVPRALERALLLAAAVFLVCLPAFAAASAAFGDDIGNPAGAPDVFGVGAVPGSRLVFPSSPLAHRLEPSSDPARETIRGRSGEALRAPPGL